jgi:peptide/nickel transport system permease protein
VIQRGVDTAMAIPGIVLALAIMSVLGQSLTNIVLVIALVIAPGASRVVRGTVLAIKEQTFIDAAHASGASAGRVVLRHVLPNVFAPILIIATVWLGNAIVIEAALSFLGLGTPPPTPTWGGMLSGEGRRNLETAPYLAIFPGLAISIVVLAFNMLGDALRDLWDPRLRNR